MSMFYYWRMLTGLKGHATYCPPEGCETWFKHQNPSKFWDDFEIRRFEYVGVCWCMSLTTLSNAAAIYQGLYLIIVGYVWLIL